MQAKLFLQADQCMPQLKFARNDASSRPKSAKIYKSHKT
jgi:hypothetical protein